MKKYIKSHSETPKVLAIDTPYIGYCTYTASNDTWGYDSLELLQSIGGDTGYVKIPNDRGSYYRPQLYYLFESEDQYNEFAKLLKDYRLDGFIELYSYYDLPQDAVILSLGQ